MTFNFSQFVFLQYSHDTFEQDNGPCHTDKDLKLGILEVAQLSWRKSDINNMRLKKIYSTGNDVFIKIDS